jgi:hypothetical protein
MEQHLEGMRVKKTILARFDEVSERIKVDAAWYDKPLRRVRGTHYVLRGIVLLRHSEADRRFACGARCSRDIGREQDMQMDKRLPPTAMKSSP